MSETQGARPARGDGATPPRYDVMDDPPRFAEWTTLDSVKLGVGVGLVLAAVGVGLGVLLVAQTVPTDCVGDGGPCAHPQGLEGAVVVVFSLVLAILVWLAGRVAKAALRT